MLRRCCLLVLIAFLATFAARAETVGDDTEPVRKVTIRAPRDIGYFVGDLVHASIDILVADGFELEPSSLPHPGPIAYWLDLRSIDVTRHSASGGDRLYTLNITYQNFYDALDARPQEIPTFEVTFKKGDETRSAFVPAWTIGVSALREVAPPIKSDPKNYMRADEPALFVKTDGLWEAAGIAALAAALALLLLVYDKGLWPFHARPARAFGDVARGLRRLSVQGDTDQRYLEALLLLHRGIDRTDGRRILADDLDAFVGRHPVFLPLSDGLGHFFAASRHAFFGSDPARSRATMPFKAIERLAQRLSAAERTRP